MKIDDVLVTCYAKEDETIVVRFFRVLKSTSNTCEIRELRKEIVQQIGRLQEVVPRLSVFQDEPPFRCKIKNEQVEIDELCFARLWGGESKWQKAIIHIHK